MGFGQLGQRLAGDVWLQVDRKGSKLFPDGKSTCVSPFTEISYLRIFFPRLIALFGLGLPISFYFWQRGGKQKPKTNVVREERRGARGANQEYTDGAEGNEGNKPPLKGKGQGFSSFDDDKVCHSINFLSQNPLGHVNLLDWTMHCR